MFTRKQLKEKGMLDAFPYSVLSAAFSAMSSGRTDRVCLYHSDVYYVRAAMEKRCGFLFTLPEVEKAMKAEGWRDRGRK
jgi:tRNA A37 threonylcarbamoyladenosine biosynthesis protein TsaE